MPCAPRRARKAATCGGAGIRNTGRGRVLGHARSSFSPDSVSDPGTWPTRPLLTVALVCDPVNVCGRPSKRTLMKISYPNQMRGANLSGFSLREHEGADTRGLRYDSGKTNCTRRPPSG